MGEIKEISTSTTFMRKNGIHKMYQMPSGRRFRIRIRGAQARVEVKEVGERRYKRWKEFATAAEAQVAIFYIKSEKETK